MHAQASASTKAARKAAPRRTTRAAPAAKPERMSFLSEDGLYLAATMGEVDVWALKRLQEDPENG